MVAVPFFASAGVSHAHPPRFHVLAAFEQNLKQAEADKAAEDETFVYDKPDALAPARVMENPLWYEASLAADGDAMWYAWLEFSPGQGDRIWVGRRAEGEWLDRQLLLPEHGDYANPRLTKDKGGALWLSYEAAPKDGPWDVWLKEVKHEQGKLSSDQPEPRRISPGDGSDIHHSIAADPTGGLWLAWQTDNEGQFDIAVRHVHADSMQDAQTFGTNPRGDWHPSIASAKDGTAHVVWDAHDGTSYNVFWEAIGKTSHSRVQVTDSPVFEGRAQVVVDGDDRVWIAWEEGGANWGAPYRPKLTTESITDAIGPLHRFRYVRLAEGLSNLTVRRVADLPMPAHVLAAKREGLNPGASAVGAFYERSRLAVDGRGRLWIAYRHYYTPWLGVKHHTHVEAGWGVYARCLTEQGWSDLFRFAGVQGDGMQSLELAGQPDGVAAVWTTGRTQRTDSKLPRGIVIGSLSLMAGDPVSKAANLPGDNPPTRSNVSPIVAQAEEAERPKMELAGETYELYFGDLHRHTDLSLCRVPIDGTIDDNYRYAIDAAQLDFLGITDHSRDLAQGDHLSQLWWRSRKEVERHRLGTRFFPFYSYERSHGDTADHNVISLRDDMLRPHTYSIFKFLKELDPATTFTIPHQPVRRDTWVMQDDERRPLVEIYQGARDTIIDEDVHNGLNKGYKLGIIASSDHMSTSASYACVWAKEPSRAEIFAAMRSRRTYGATSKIRLSVRAGEHWMGEVVDAPTLPPLQIQAVGTAPFRAVNFVVDGQIVKTLSPRDASLNLTQEIDMQGKHYVYVHLIQADGNHGWSSPLWVQPKATP